MNTPRLILAALASLVLSAAASAQQSAAFVLSYCAETATDIVVVQERTDTDLPYTVLESWKGNFHKGDKLALPGLPLSSTLTARPTGSDHPLTGDRLVLFLKPEPDAHAGAADAAPPALRPKPVAPDQPARLIGAAFGEPTHTALAGLLPDNREIALSSVVWIHSDTAYAFDHGPTRGPSTLAKIAPTETRFKELCEFNFKDRDALAAAIKLPDAERAHAITALTRSPNQAIRREALTALGACGQSALPDLRTLLHDRAIEQWQLARAICTAAGPEACNILSSLIADEHPFWLKHAPKLGDDWWTTGPDSKQLQARFYLLFSLTEQLAAGAPCPAAREPLTQVRDLWSSLPQLKKGMGQQLIDRCTAILDRPTEAAADH